MKATKKIVGAASALVVAVALSAGSTFAWFSTNNVVSAGNMSISANATGNLLISDTAYNATDFGFEADLSDQASEIAENVMPISTSPDGLKMEGYYDGESSTISTESAVPTFYKVATGGAPSADNSTVSAETTFAALEDETYFAKATVWVKSLGSDIDGIAVKLTVEEDGAANLTKALRVMFVTNDGAFIYSPDSTDTTYNPIDKPGVYDTAVSDTAVTISKQTGAGQDNIFPTTDMTADYTYQIDVYVWFEGQDSDCVTNNAINTTATSISFEFTAIPKA